MMTLRRTVGALVVLASLVLSGCTPATPVWSKRGGPPRVVVTIPPLDNFVRNVGGDHIAVVSLCTDKGPHHYEYAPQDALLLREADLFFAIGLTLDDSFADPAQVASHNPRLRYVKLGERLPENLLITEEHEEPKGKEEHKHAGHEGHEGHHHGAFDPHVWLGIPQCVQMVETIRDELKKVDSAHADDYDRNAAGYVESLKKLQSHGKEVLKDKKDRKIISFHESLRYFAKSFDIHIVDSIERAPGEEPTPAHLAELVKRCKEEKVRVIAVEPQYQKGTSADTLKKELRKEGVEADLVVIDPLETADKKELTDDGRELKDKKWYEMKMRQNLDALAKQLP
jgi:zinc transport system substrate-binding protein